MAALAQNGDGLRTDQAGAADHPDHDPFHRSSSSQGAESIANGRAAVTAARVAFRKEKPATRAGFSKKCGGDLLSHTASRAVPSALVGLTSVFGMGTGVTPPK